MSFEKPLIIAHRGASAHAPENTYAAFKRAIEGGADGIEFDVRFSKDRIPVVFHDSDLKRLAHINRRVADLTAKELGEIDVGSWFNQAFPKRANERFAAEMIPTLANVLKFLSEYEGLIYIELKGKNAVIPSLAETVCELIRLTNRLPNIVVKSFKLEGIKTVKQILPQVRTAALFEPKILTILQKKKRILEEAEEFQADEISIHHSLATKNFVRRAREKGFSTIVWTTNNPVWIKRAFDFEIHALITNKPAEFLAERARILKNSS
ncbi:MAG: hypothetical protein M3T96_04125 [Acidobacteriota bacterium]|nr:hypothetical protein [Acidobacteriota bacterium]